MFTESDAFKGYTKGYDANAVQQRNPGHSNGNLTFFKKIDNKYVYDSIPLWVYEFQTGFRLSGSTAQSANTRSYFPKNIEQLNFSVGCQCYNQKIYGHTVEWIRDTQTKLESSVRLYIQGRNSVRGNPVTIQAEGYIKTINRTHERFIYAPTLQIDFLVEKIISPSQWADTPNPKSTVFKTWADLVLQQKRLFIADPDDVKASDSAYNLGASVYDKANISNLLDDLGL